VALVGVAFVRVDDSSFSGMEEPVKTLLPFALLATLALAACGDDQNNNAAGTPPPPPAATTETAPPPPARSEAGQEAREAGQAIEDAARQSGDAIGAAARDLQERAGPAMERARQEGAEALENAKQGINNLTRSAACQTARAANDAEGIAANCG